MGCENVREEIDPRCQRLPTYLDAEMLLLVQVEPFLLLTVESALRKLTFKDNNGVSSRRKVTSIDVSKLYLLILQVDMYSEQSPLSLVKHKITSQEQSFRSSQPV